MPSWEEIQKMSDEEVKAMNAKLGAKAVKQFMLFQAIKWTAIIGLTYFMKRSMESMLKEMNQE